MICKNGRFYDEQEQKLPLDNAVTVIGFAQPGQPAQSVQLKKNTQTANLAPRSAADIFFTAAIEQSSHKNDI